MERRGVDVTPPCEAAPDRATLEQRNRELAILSAIATALNGSVELRGVLEAALACVIELLELETGWIWLLHAETGEAYLAASKNLPPGLAADPTSMEGPCYCLDALERDKLDPATNIGVMRCSRLGKLAAGTGGYLHHASVPLLAHGQKLGLLNVATAEWRELESHELRLLHTVSGLLGIAIERTRLYDESARLGAAEERNRLAREFHDTLAQSLVATAQQLEVAEALLERGPAGAGADQDKVRAVIARALVLTRSTLEETRRSVHDLRATPLEGRSLAEALRAEVDALRGRTQAEVTFTTAGASRPLPSRVEVGMLRIGQEALANVARHAAARTVTVELTGTPTALVLVVADDGGGFDPARVGEAPVGSAVGRFGLVGMNERARLLGGSLHVASEPGRGTRIHVRVPLVEGEPPS
jgi:two-component system NarL family sensor kinase